jgi:hypothetical protein
VFAGQSFSFFVNESSGRGFFVHGKGWAKPIEDSWYTWAVKIRMKSLKLKK